MRSLALASSLLLALSVPASAQLTSQEEAVLLDQTNLRRSDVAQGLVSGQPSAADMKRLLWDDGLAQVAQGWADGCDFSHNPNRAQDLIQFPTDVPPDEAAFVGENIYASSSPLSAAVLENGVDAWFDEHPNYDFETNTCASGATCGHYTQVVWADTRYVGCGARFCDPLKGLSFAGTYLVCNFARAGNFVGQKPYVAGAACTSCPSGLEQCVDGLCSVPEPSSALSRLAAIVGLALVAHRRRG